MPSGRHAQAGPSDALVLVGSWIIGAALLGYATYGGLSQWSRPATSPLIPLALSGSIAVFAGGAFTVARRRGMVAWALTSLVAVSTAVRLAVLVIRR